MKTIIQKIALVFLALGGVAQAAEEKLTTDAPVLWDIPLPFWPGHSLPVTNSMLMLLAAVILITVVLLLATRKM